MTYRLHVGDWIEQLRTLPDESVHCCVTSPPYWGLRDYGVAGQCGLEASLAEFLAKLVAGFEEVRRVLRKDGTCWVNMGDCYVTKQNTGTGWNSQINGRGTQIEAGKASRHLHRTKASTGGLKQKDMVGQPWRLAFALQDAGWFLRADIIWHKPNPMPESVKDRPGRAHEYLFLLSKSAEYHYDTDATREPYRTADRKGARRSYPAGTASSYDLASGHQGMRGSFVGLPLNEKGRNKRSVWTIPPQPFKGAHFAVYPERLVEPCILAGCPRGGVVLDPFTGSGTTGAVALRLGRSFVGIELNPQYAAMADRRLAEAWANGVQERIEGVA